MQMNFFSRHGTTRHGKLCRAGLVSKPCLLQKFFEEGEPITAVFISREEKQLSVQLTDGFGVDCFEFRDRMAMGLENLTSNVESGNEKVVDAISPLSHSFG